MKKELGHNKIWEVKPGTKVITIPKYIHTNFVISKVVVHYTDGINKKISRFGIKSKSSQEKLNPPLAGGGAGRSTREKGVSSI